MTTVWAVVFEALSWYSFGMTEADKKKIAEIMEKHGVIVGYLFGSAARGTMGPLSDIDVAVLFDEFASSKKQESITEDIRDAIANLFDKEKVDVINLNQQTNPVLRYEAVLEGEAIFVKDISIKARLARAVLREYEDTRYLRETSYRILREQIKSGEFGRASIDSKFYVASQ